MRKCFLKGSVAVKFRGAELVIFSSVCICIQFFLSTLCVTIFYYVTKLGECGGFSPSDLTFRSHSIPIVFCWKLFVSEEEECYCLIWNSQLSLKKLSEVSSFTNKDSNRPYLSGTRNDLKSIFQNLSSKIFPGSKDLITARLNFSISWQIFCYCK